jgi:hypothetical protein
MTQRFTRELHNFCIEWPYAEVEARFSFLLFSTNPCLSGTVIPASPPALLADGEGSAFAFVAPACAEH